MKIAKMNERMQSELDDANDQITMSPELFKQEPGYKEVLEGQKNKGKLHKHRRSRQSG